MLELDPEFAASREIKYKASRRKWEAFFRRGIAPVEQFYLGDVLESEVGLEAT